jgi:membrane protein DedA with SNARE-associated domain
VIDPAGLAARLSAGASGPWLLVGLALATLVSEDLACVAAGLLVARGSFGLAPASLACFLGIFGGDLLLFLAGRWGGRAALARPPFSWWIRPEQVERGEAWFRERTGRVLFATRFLPGSRLPTYVAAGLLGCPIRTFAFWLAVAGAIWTPILVWLASTLGAAVFGQLQRYGRGALPLAIAALALYLLATRSIPPLFTRRGRRLALGRWRRLTRWEFWPAWLVNIPVVLYAAGQALRHRSPTVFTAVNPAMPAGGFVLESKVEILAALEAGGAPIARFARLSEEQTYEQRLATVHAFLAEQGLDFPVVFKPDVGQRGEGVAVIKSAEALAAHLATATGEGIVQEYVPGREFGVFYIRHPDEPQGRIFSITDKRLPTLLGDGEKTLEELILADDRAVCMAPLHLARHQARLDQVPAAGERIELVEIGNHCRGAIFLNGIHLATPELTAAIDAASRGYEGFFFGRYDLRVPSEEQLKAGRDFRILELNGVTSEATHIYEPGASLLAAYRTLFTQWRLAFEIGAANVKGGARATPLRELVGLLRAHFSR